MRKMLFTLVAVLSVANISLAEYLPTLREIDNGNPNILTYVVGLQVDDEGGISSISDINVTGDVCQIFILGETETPDMIWFPSYPDYMDMAHYEYLDTHLLDLDQYGTGDVMVGDGWAEDNDGSDPAGINAETEGLFVGGIGDLYLSGTPTTIAVLNPLLDLNEMEFVQVAIPYDPNDPFRYSATVTGLYCNHLMAEESTMAPFSIHVGIIPEPSTIAMLFLGALCLLGFRRK